MERTAERTDVGGDLIVTIVNEDDGHEIELHAGRGTPVGTLVERMYRELRLERQTDDRLRCEATGEDVLGFSSMHLGDYLTGGHCASLTWLFAGGTGGA